jgi:type II secretory pathway pseudopilin PulG
VVVLIGILSALAYSSLMDVIFTNRAKEAAHTMVTFTERVLADGKRQSRLDELTIGVNGSSIFAVIATDTIARETITGFNAQNPGSAPTSGTNFNAAGAKSKQRIGISGIDEEGYFVVCGSRGYCGAAVKKMDKNYFEAHIRKGTNATWGAL